MTMYRWFELGYQRAEAAQAVMELPAVETVCDGYRRTAWSAKAIGVTCLLGHYRSRNIYDRDLGTWVAMPYPFYRAQLTYTGQEAQRIDAMIDFDHHSAQVVRCSEYSRYPDPVVHANRIWDEAMAMLDESLMIRARAVGLLLIADVAERTIDATELAKAA